MWATTANKKFRLGHRAKINNNLPRWTKPTGLNDLLMFFLVKKSQIYLARRAAPTGSRFRCCWTRGTCRIRCRCCVRWQCPASRPDGFAGERCVCWRPTAGRPGTIARPRRRWDRWSRRRRRWLWSRWLAGCPWAEWKYGSVLKTQKKTNHFH